MGFPHPRYLLPLLSLEDLVDWQARYELQPWGEVRADLRNVVLMSYVLAPFQSATAPDPPNVVWPYHDAEDAAALDLDATADALTDHLQRCYAAHGSQDDRLIEHPGRRVYGDAEP